jgi:hypothetical protein
MILGFASSWAMAEIGKVGSELFVDDVTLTGVSAQPAKLNGGFETWNSKTLENPQNWYMDTNNADAYKKTTDAAEGNYALEMTTFQSQDEGINIIRPATISNGYYDDNIDNWAGGTPFTNTVDTLAFYYKYAPAQPKDSAQVWVQFKKNGSFFWFNNVFLTASSTYKYVELPIAIMHPFYRPDSVIIYAQSSLWDNANQSVGSVLKIDDIHFKSRDMVTTLEPVRESAVVSIFPNPSDGLFRVDLNGKEVVSVVVFNLSGQQVLSLGKTQLSANPEIDMTAFPRGVYLVRINDGNKAYVEKLILK